MKNKLFTKKILDSDSLLSAVKKAQGKAGAGINATTSSIGVGIPSNAKIANAELKDSISPYYSAAWNKAAEEANSLDKQVANQGKSNSSAPRMSEVQKDEVAFRTKYLKSIAPTMSEVQKDEIGFRTKHLNASVPRMNEIQRDEDKIRFEYDDPESPSYEIPTLSEVQNNELYIRERFPIDKEARNDYLSVNLLGKPHDETNNEFYDEVAQNQLTGFSGDGTPWSNVTALKRAERVANDFNSYFQQANIVESNLTEEQKEAYYLIKNELMQQAFLGNLSNDEKERIIREGALYIIENIEPANGQIYHVPIELKDPKPYVRQMMPELGTLPVDGLSEADINAIFDYGRFSSRDKEQNDIFSQQRAFKEAIFMEEVERYNNDLRNGKVKLGNFQEYYNRAMVKIYDYCIKPIPVKDNKGKAAGTVAIGDLIAPYDDSFGAKVARTAFQLIGLPYGTPAGQGNRPKLVIDCQGLVRWVLSEINTDWGDYGIGKGARYQIDDTVATWSIDDGDEIESEDLQVGNTLFWQGDETGEIKHTAIYIGKFNEVDYMIEAAGGSVRIVPLRMHTSDPKGEDSTLCQINQMLPERLDENVTEYFQTNNG